MGPFPQMMLAALVLAAFALASQQRLAIASHSGPAPARQIAYLLRSYHSSAIAIKLAAPATTQTIVAGPPSMTGFISCADAQNVVTTIDQSYGAARDQQIIMATPDAADYLVRGYLSATAEGDQTAVTYVIDIFDAKKQRTQRIEDAVLVKGAAADPWSVIDDNALAAVAAKSAAGLAAVLTNTPQAISAASQNGNATPNPTAQAEPPDRTVVAASPGPGPLGIPGLPH